MFIPLSQTMTLTVKHLTQRGNVYQFYRRVPRDLVGRYGQTFIRESLNTTNEKEAIRKAQVLTTRTDAEFAALRNNPDVTPQSVSLSAMDLAKALSEDTEGVLIDHLLEPKREAYAAASDDPEWTYNNADPSEYLSPVETEALTIYQTGVDKPRLSDALTAYWNQHKKAGDATITAYVGREWNNFSSFAGNVPIESINRALARKYVEHLLSQGLKTGSVRRKLNSINAVLNAALRELEISKVNPFAAIRIKGEGTDANKGKIPDTKDLHSIINHFKGKNNTTALIILIMLETGPRIAEIACLKVSDVFLDSPVPYVRVSLNEWRGTKNEYKLGENDPSIREFPLVGVSLEAMRKALAKHRTNAALFPEYGRQDGNTAASAAINKALKPWGITSKSFRHSLKDRLRNVGCPKDIRDAIQGHDNPDVAETYGMGHTLETMQEWLLKAKVI